MHCCIRPKKLINTKVGLIDQASDVPSIIIFYISYRLRALKTLYFYFRIFFDRTVNTEGPRNHFVQYCVISLKMVPKIHILKVIGQ